ncbi:DUF2490 domain-containing protein [Sphingobium nicotianae]|uniref:DUF2490 domain-containing protein n=1 Tax=Sphingobium nicotianae TaxID=2782607 RepID=UPI001BE3EFB7
MSTRAAAHDEDVELWLGQSLSHRIDGGTSISLDLSERLREARVGGDQYLGRITLTRRIAPGVEIALGASAATNGGIGEIRPEQAIILTRGVLAVRSRLEERMIDGVADTSYRLRERLALNLPLDARARWVLIASGEAFFALNRTRPSDVTGFNTLRTQLGVRHAFTPALSLTALYQRQQAVRPGRADSVAHIPLLSIGWTL